MDARETDFSRTMIWWKTSWKVAEYDGDVDCLNGERKGSFKIVIFKDTRQFWKNTG